MTVMLTAKTPIPANRRTLLRHVIKGKPEFNNWHMGLLVSRKVTNSQILRFALDCGYTDLVEDILTAPPEQLMKAVHHRRNP